jgi:hypothetical protein
MSGREGSEVTTRTGGAELACSFCGEQQPAVKLVAGPTLFICDRCVAGCVEIIGAGGGSQTAATGLAREPLQQGGLHTWLFPKLRARRPVQPTCSFCGKADQVFVQPPSTLGTQALICEQCLNLCQDLVRPVG